MVRRPTDTLNNDLRHVRNGTLRDRYRARMDLTIAILGVVATLIAAGAAVGSWRAALASNKTGSRLAEIEHSRRHTELTPQFAITITQAAGNDDNAIIHFELIGPPGLGSLDEIRASIRDDTPDRLIGQPLAGGPTKEQIAEQVWGPYTFSPRVNGAPQSGRSVEPFSLRMGDRTRRQLSRSAPPLWAGSSRHEWWGHEVKGQPVRLALECQKEGWELWTVVYVIDIAPPAER